MIERVMQERIERHFHSEARALVMLITGDLAHEPDENQVKALIQALVAAYRLGYRDARDFRLGR